MPEFIHIQNFGIKVADLLDSYHPGKKIRLFRGSWSEGRINKKSDPYRRGEKLDFLGGWSE